MKKRFSIATLVAVVLLAVILTFQVTYVSVSGYLDDKISIGNGVSSENSEQNEFIGKVVDRLSILDSTFRELYIGDIDDEQLIDYILKGYMAGTGDDYGNYYNADELSEFMSDLSGETVGVGINIIHNTDYNCIEVINVIPNSPALEAGLLHGDLIVSIGEEEISVASIGYEAALAKLRGEVGTVAVFSVMREGEEKPIKFSIERANVTDVTVYSHVCETDPSVGIIKITSFDLKTPEQFKNAVTELLGAGCSSFVFDMRYNPGGELQSVVNILDYLLSEGPIVRIFDGKDNLVREYTSNAEHVGDYPMAVLVNGSTASAAELFTSALKDYDRATVVGETTYGKGCMQTTMSLPDGGAVVVTYRMYNPPFSDNYHGVGIVPHVEIALNEALKNKNVFKVTDAEDNQLQAAISELKK